MSDMKGIQLPRTKKEMVSVLETALKEISREMRTSPRHSLIYYNALSLSLEEVAMDMQFHNFFDVPEDWYYSLEITNRGSVLCLKHIAGVEEDEEGRSTVSYDEHFSLRTFPKAGLTVEEYAKKVGKKPVTVRQWIRRGQMRSAYRIGGEWRIPRICDGPAKSSLPVTYYLSGEALPLPEKFFGMRLNVRVLLILPEGKGKFSVWINGAPLGFGRKLYTDQERIELETLLLSTEGVTNDFSRIGHWPGVPEESRCMAVLRAGNMR